MGSVRIEDIEANLLAGGGKGPFMLTLDGYPAGTDPGARVPIIMLQGMIKCVRVWIGCVNTIRSLITGHRTAVMLTMTAMHTNTTHHPPKGAPATRW